MSEKLLEVKIIPEKELFYKDESSYGIYVIEDTKGLRENNRGSVSIKGNTVRLGIGREYSAKLIEKEDKQYGIYYEIRGVYEKVPTTKDGQKSYLLSILTENQVKQIYKTYPNEDVVKLIQEDKFDYTKVHGVGLKTYIKMKDKIIENVEFQQAFEFLSGFGVTNNLIIKLVKHFKSASLLIKKIKSNPYSITEVAGVGFKKADTIALSMGYDPEGEYRITAAIEHAIEEEAKNGHTYCTINKMLDIVFDLTNIDYAKIKENIKETDKVIVFENRLALKRLHRAEKFISDRLHELLDNSTELTIDVDEFLIEQQERYGLELTDQQKEFFHNVKSHNVNILAGFAGCGKSLLQKLLINMLEKLGISYKLLAPTGKAAKVLANYTNRMASTIHRATLNIKQPKEAQDDEDKRIGAIEERFVIVDETSMMDVTLAKNLLYECTNDKLRILFIGDPFQIPSVSAGNFLHDAIESKVLPTTMLDIVFRQKEGGILDIATKIRKKQPFLNNSDTGLFKFGENCVVACVPQEKIEGGYKYFYNQLLEKYKFQDICMVTPTKKGKLGTFEINKHAQEIVNAKDFSKKEYTYGFDKVVFRENDLVINIKNTYDILNCNDNLIDIVNGDTGTIEKIDDVEKEVIVDFGFDKVPMEYKMLDQLLHAWCLTKHKVQGSSYKAVIAIADKSHKFQINANLIYTAFTRPEEYLVILTQAETINYAIKKVANLQRNTFLQEMLVGRV